MVVVYIHTFRDSNTIFYVGCSVDQYRPTRRANHSEQWQAITKDRQYKVTVLIEGISLLNALAIERGLIEYYGRMVHNTGPLVNVSPGGEARNVHVPKWIKPYVNPINIKDLRRSLPDWWHNRKL